jgi:hypothetical protein
LSPTQSSVPPWLKIDVHHTYEIRFGLSTYARKEDKINFPMALILGPNNIGFNQNCLNKCNIHSPTRLGAVYITTDAQDAYDIQLGYSWTPWKGKETTFTMELVPYPNSSEINRDCQKNWTSRICLGVTPSFLTFGPHIMSIPLGLHPEGTCTSLDPLQSVASAPLEFGVLLILICQEQFRRTTVYNTPHS